ncbi:MAG: beta-glucosidase H [Acidimicrobiales bacterium]
MRRTDRPRREFARAGTAAVLGGLVLAGLALPVAVAAPASAASSVSRCPWVDASLHHRSSPAVLAREVVARMTLSEKANFAVLKVHAGVENTNVGVSGLCIPALTLTDGPNGVGSAQTGVTQFPAEIAIAAGFNPSLAHAVGVAMGQETRAKGFDVLQGPNLNLSRVPLSGRIFETYGEDPVLTSAMGVATIRGIQSVGVMANAKHFTGYTQETARGRVNQLVPTRALEELYNVPFRDAVTEAHVASIMCAMGSLNGVNNCSSPYVYNALKSWGFSGFVRSDYQAIFRVAPAFAAGLSLIKPGSAAQLIDLVNKHQLPVAALDRAVTAVLTEMFAYGFIAHPRLTDLGRRVTSAAHAQVALRAAEASVVLLKNQDSILPLPSSVGSIAVIGADAKTAPLSTGGGSSTVKAPYVVTPLQAITTIWGKHATISYSPGGPRGLELDQLQFSDLVSGKPLPKQIPIATTGEPGKADLVLDFAHTVTSSVATAVTVGRGDGWSHWQVVLRVPRSGTYEFALQQIGDTWFTVDGKTLFASPGIHGPTNWAATLNLVAGHDYRLSAHWFAVNTKVVPKLGVSDVTGAIAAAVSAARKAKVAVVFAGSFSTEGADQLSLSLPGDSNALISAVAAANPHTIVVLNTSGAVYMPWLSHVQAVIEAWYPGQMDGTAIAAVLSGAVDPSGHLPITFPASTTPQPAAVGAAFPGINAAVSFGSGLDLGYRWFGLNNVTPLFPFGYGLSYTTFRLSSPSVSTTATDVVVHVTATNTGARSGSDAVQAYVAFPSGANEPPLQLRAFTEVGLAPGQSRAITLTIPRSTLRVYASNRWTTVPGAYGVDVGSSSADLPVRLSVTLP